MGGGVVLGCYGGGDGWSRIGIFVYLRGRGIIVEDFISSIRGWVGLRTKQLTIFCCSS